MPQADIEINAVTASNEDLPINVAVQLSNNDVGDESTYLWSIVSQPPGPADAFSSTIIENPVLTPLKEDTYLVQLIVDLGLPGESTDRKLFRVRRFKSNAALISTAETVQGTQGAWSLPQNENLDKLLGHMYDGEVVVAQAGAGLVAGAAVQFDETNTIKTGLPGQERVPRVNAINGTDPLIASKVVGLVIGKPDGSTPVLANDMVLVRTTGFFDLANVGVPAIGDPVFINDSGILALVQGTNRKKVGVVIDDTAGAWRAYLSTLTEEGGAHAIGGGFHIADSLANINTKVAGGNLDFDSASRPAQAHLLGSANHTADSLANINAKVTGGDLDFNSASRPPNGAAGGALGGSYPNPSIATSQVSSIALTTTTSAGNVLVSLMTLTPVAGTYLAWFAGSVDHSSTGEVIFTSVFAGGSLNTGSERRFRRGGGQGDVQGGFCCVAIVTVNGAEAIEGRWATTAATASMYERALIIQKVSA